MNLGHIPSLSMCLIKNNTVEYKSYGYYKLITKQKPTKNTVYFISSISKTITATALLQLYEKGLFDLDDDINDYLDFKVRNPNYQDIPITFRMLLAHQSSLGGPETLSFYLIFSYIKNKINYPYSMIKDMIIPNGSLYTDSIWNNYSPGLDSDYSNLGFILLEYLIEVISKQKFTEYCKENIFNPLKMDNTSFHLKNFKNDQLAISYTNIGPLIIPLPFIEGLYGSGGLRTSVEDFSHYMIIHMNGGVWNGVRILKESTVEMMHTPQYPNNSNKTTKFGLGWFIWDGLNGNKIHGHPGCSYGMTSSMEFNLSNDWAILFFMNNAINFSNHKESFIYFIIIRLLLQKVRDM